MTAIYFDARIDGQQLQADIARINANIQSMSAKIRSEGNEIDNITRKMSVGLAGAFSVFASGAFIKDIARVRGEYQQLEVAFETMLGSKAKADQLMAEVVQFAARTPFELGDVASGAKQLLAYGIAADNIIPTLKALGDVSAGLSVPIERLILNYGQVRTQLKMTGRELRDFQVAGVPIVAELAKQLNVAEKQIADMVSAGQIGFEEVEAAFRSMTDEGGKFNDLMDKQASTITGLASNFADAWDKMLNAIGEQNQGILAGSIKGAIELVENYEKVLNILKLLVITYGTYKAAVIATGVATKITASYGVYDIVTKKLQVAATLKAAAAATALNAAMLVNPYVAVATAVVGLVAALAIFGNETKKTEKYIEDLNESIESIGKQIEVDSLINRYVELRDKTERTKEEQEELNNTIDQLAQIFPDAINKTDQFGKAIELNTEKVSLLNDEIRSNIQLLTEKRVGDSQERLNELIERRKRLLEEANSGEIQVTDEEGRTRTVTLGTEAIIKRREEVENLNVEIDNLTKTILESEQQLQSIGAIDAEKVLEPYKTLFGQVDKYSREEALKIKAALTELLTLGLGRDAESKIKEEITRISDQLALPTVREQIKRATDDLKKAKAELDKMRSPGSTSTTDEINLKEEEVDKLEKDLAALTGVRKKDSEKAIKEEKEKQKELLKAAEQFAAEQLALERSMQAAKVAIMQEGAERERKEAELTYQQQLDQISRQQEEYLKAWNATKGFEPGDAGYSTEMPVDDLKKFNQLRIDAETEKNNRITEINRNAALQVKAIWSDATDSFLTDSEREINQINAQYDALIERAKKAGETDFTAINEARAKAIDESTIRSGIERLDFEEDIELRRAEISIQGYNRDIDLEKKKLQILKTFAQKKIDLLKASGLKESENDIKLLQLFIESADEGLKEINEKSIAAAVVKIQEMASAMKEFTDTVFGAESQLGSLLNELTSGAAILGNIASGNYVGAAAGFLQTIAGWYQQTVVSSEQLAENERKTREEALQLNDIYRDRLKLLEALGLISPTEAFSKDLEIINKQLDISKEKLDGYQQNFILNGRATSATLKQIFDTVYGFDWGVEEFNEAINDWDALFEKYLGKVGGVAYTNHPLSKFSWIFDKEQFNEDLNEILSYANEIEIINESQRKKLTQTTAEGVTDAIIEGFRSGYTSAEEFADMFENYMRDAMIQALAIQYLDGPLKVWRNYFTEFMQDGIISPEEREKLQNGFYDSAGVWVQGWNDMVNNMRTGADMLSQAAGIDIFDTAGKTPNGLTGAIKGITEETAGLIAGQFFAFRELQQKTYLNGVEQLDMINQSLVHLAEIASNTRHNSRLVKIEELLTSMDSKL